MDVLLMLIIVLLGIALLVLLFAQRRYRYWIRRGVPQLQPEFLFGDVKKWFLLQDCQANCFIDFYQKFRSMGVKHGGIYTLFRPTWIPIDPDLIKRIMQTDFQYFTSHGSYNHKMDDLSMNLFRLDGGQYWKNLRVKMTPTLTSGKLKNMMVTLLEKATVLKTVADEFATKNAPIDIKNVLSRFTTDIIGSVAFGIECNSLTEPDDNVFRKYGTKALESSFARAWCEGFLPQSTLALDRLEELKYKTFSKTWSDRLYKIEKRTTFIGRNDFLHLLIQLKNRGELSEEGGIGKTSTKGEFLITEHELIAQTFIFFIAGYETSSSTSTFALYELAKNPEIQEKVRQEIVQVLEKYDSEITYDALMEMTYTEKVINESLRKYPPVSTIPRECTRDYKVPGTDLIIQKGTMVQIPAMGIQRDPEYYPNPDQFNPHNFDKENIDSRPDFTWIPFGEGPRKCIGMRLGLLQTKIGLISIVKNYRISVNPKTLEPLEFDSGCVMLTVKGDIWLNLQKV